MKLDEDSTGVKDASLKYTISFVGAERESKYSVAIEKSPISWCVEASLMVFTCGGNSMQELTTGCSIERRMNNTPAEGGDLAYWPHGSSGGQLTVGEA